MASFTKLHSSLLTSTIWGESPVVCKVWITMLAAADVDGVVEATVPGLARLANLSVSEVEAALERLMSPDAYSRTPDREGRRVEVVSGGWRLINYDKYRELMSAEDVRTKAALRQQRYRERHKASHSVMRDAPLCLSRQAEAEVEVEVEVEVERKTRISTSVPANSDVSLDGQAAFEHACSLYPKPERDHPTQVLYFEAIGRIRAERSCNDLEATDWLNSRISLYASRVGQFAVGFEKFLRKQIYKQPESAWGGAGIEPESPGRGNTSLSLSERLSGGDHAN